MPLSKTSYLGLKNDFLGLLFALTALIFIPSFIPSGFAKDISIYATLFISVIISVLVAARNKHILLVGIGLASIVLLINILPLTSSNTAVFLGRILSFIFFFSYIAVQVLYRIALAQKVSLNILYGAITGYLLMGVLGGFWCRLIEFLYPDSFSMATGLTPEIDTLIYFSFVTMSSLGYGDITPITPPGRSTAIFIAITGQMYMTISIALLVGNYVQHQSGGEELNNE